MLIRKILVTLSLVTAALPAAYADSGEQRLLKSNDASSSKSRSEVREELQVSRKNSVGTEGGSQLDSERSFVTPQHSYGFQSGALVHTDKLAHDTPKPGLSPLTEEQRSLYRN